MSYMPVLWHLVSGLGRMFRHRKAMLEFAFFVMLSMLHFQIMVW